LLIESDRIIGGRLDGSDRRRGCAQSGGR
jgi:hypothetical protein